jgi:hypothetical protein
MRSLVDQQSHVKDRLNELVQSPRKNNVVKQIWRVKKDSRENIVPYSAPNYKKPAELMLATKGKEVKRVTFREPIVESKQANTKVPKVQEELHLCNTKSQPGCPLGLTSWQERKLKRLSAEKLKSMNMAWVPKGMPQGKVDVQPPVAVIAAKMKEERTKANKLSRQRFPSYKRFQSAHHSYYSATPFMLMPWNSYSGMICYPPWNYFHPWTHHNCLHHERVLPNHYSFD